MKLLYITQKLHDQDRFTQLWIDAFRRQGFEIIVVCLEKKISNLPYPVYSMGKELGYSRLRQVWTFWKLITTLKYDRVFIHMAPLYGALGVWYWPLKRIPVYLWYTHWPMNPPLWITTRFAKRFFCAGFTSLPGFEGDPRKVVTGHGIDRAFWKQQPNCAQNPYAVLVVHRLCRSKRLDIGIRALALLPEKYTMTVYGAPLEPDFVSELHALVKELKLESRVRFMETASMEKVRDELFPKYKMFFNMAYETLDKTMVECLSAGMWLVTTSRNAESIGLTKAPTDDSPPAVAKFIEWCSQHTCDGEKAYRVLAEKHNLTNTVRTMSEYIHSGK